VTGVAPGGPVTMVIGIGNRWRSDDAAGLLAAGSVRAQAPAGVEVREFEGEPVSLLDLWAGAGTVLLIDAVSSGSEAGTIHRVAVGSERLPAAFVGSSTHTIGLGHTVELGRAVGVLPRSLVIYGIEGSDFSQGSRITPAVAGAIDEVAAAVAVELREEAVRSVPGPS